MNQPPSLLAWPPFLATRILSIVLLALTLCSCATTPPFDYGPYLDHMPRSIVVLPPLDETVEADAPYGYLSVVTRPLAERGYYVFPVAVVTAMMRENGLPTPAEMHEVSLRKIDEIFGADAVLYITVTEWGTEYLILKSVTKVAAEARLVDVKTGMVLWSGAGLAQQSSSSGNQGIAGMLVGAVVNQVATSISDPSRDVARVSCASTYLDTERGLLLGHHHPGYEKDQEARRAKRAEVSDG
jgi:hypothetical protein